MKKYPTMLLFSIPSTLTTGHFNEYFIKNTHRTFIFLIPLTNQKPVVQLWHFVNGKKIKEQSFYVYKGTNILLRYVFFYFYYLYTVLFILPKKTVIFTTTPQYCLLSGMFRHFRHIEVMYHVGDYYANPTGSMRLFSYLTFYYNKHLPYVIYCSPLIKKIYQTGKRAKNGNRDYWVFGIKQQQLKKSVQENLLGYIGVLREGQGLSIILDALAKNSLLRLEIIGDGSLLPSLKREVVAKGMKKRVHFWGLVQDDAKIKRIVARWSIGLAPYDPQTTNMTYYGEPSKVKFYLEYQLPVIMTKITHLYKEIEKYHAGITMEYTTDSLLRAIALVQKRYPQIYKGVLQLSQQYEYNHLYNQSFKFLTTIFSDV